MVYTRDDVLAVYMKNLHLPHSSEPGPLDVGGFVHFPHMAHRLRLSEAGWVLDSFRNSQHGDSYAGSGECSIGVTLRQQELITSKGIEAARRWVGEWDRGVVRDLFARNDA
jgi:hypothetical protein